MSLAHTPGPWRAGGNYVFAGEPERWVASADSPYVSAAEPVANARLIAAAPDMLAALRTLVAIADADEDQDLWTDEYRRAVEDATAAIEKATVDELRRSA